MCSKLVFLKCVCYLRQSHFMLTYLANPGNVPILLIKLIILCFEREDWVNGVLVYRIEMLKKFFSKNTVGQLYFCISYLSVIKTTCQFFQLDPVILLFSIQFSILIVLVLENILDSYF